jgi:hypothetical protein
MSILTVLLIIILSGVRVSPLGAAPTTGLLYQPWMIDDGDCGAIGGMKIGRGNRSTRRKPAHRHCSGTPAVNRLSYDAACLKGIHEWNAPGIILSVKWC